MMWCGSSPPRRQRAWRRLSACSGPCPHNPSRPPVGNACANMLRRHYRRPDCRGLLPGCGAGTEQAARSATHVKPRHLWSAGEFPPARPFVENDGVSGRQDSGPRHIKDCHHAYSHRTDRQHPPLARTPRRHVSPRGRAAGRARPGRRWSTRPLPRRSRPWRPPARRSSPTASRASRASPRTRSPDSKDAGTRRRGHPLRRRAPAAAPTPDRRPVPLPRPRRRAT